MLKSATVQVGTNRGISALSVVLVLSILGLAGCGSSASSTGVGTGLTRDQFASRGNAICSMTATRIQNAAPSVFPNLSQAGLRPMDQILTYAKTVVLPQLQMEYAELTALKAPPDSNPGPMLSELEAAIDRWEGDKTIMSTTNDTSFARFDALANDFGMTECAKTDAIVRSITSGEPIST